MREPERALEPAATEAEHPPRERKSRTLLIVLLSILSLLIIAAAVLLTLDGRHIRFHINGHKELTVPYGEPYQDPGFSAVSAGDLFGEGDHPLPVRIRGEVNTDLPGDYELTYEAHWFFFSARAKRIVHVRDLKAPVITLVSGGDYQPNWIDGYQEEGYAAVDDYDGDLTARVESRYTEEGIVYTVSDSSGNQSTALRPLQFRLGRPEISLTGGEDLHVMAAMVFNDPGFSARDSEGRDLSSYVRVTGEVVPYQPGEYTLHYSIVNKQGDEVSADRTVTVEPARNPDTVTPEGKVIYLSFDDGPGPYTGRLLDVLAKYNVHATFFVTCLNSDYEDMVGRAYREGHSIGVHTASHDYYAIYASEDAYFRDFSIAEDMIYRQTGSYTWLFRFPGGSSNTVSRFNPGIMTRLSASMTDMGYTYFDWNVDSGDAGSTTKSRTVASNIISGCKGRQVSVVLQHDIKDYSVNAVEEVILWGLNNGYTFLPLDESSPNAHHGINN